MQCMTAMARSEPVTLNCRTKYRDAQGRPTPRRAPAPAWMEARAPGMNLRLAGRPSPRWVGARRSPATDRSQPDRLFVLSAAASLRLQASRLRRTEDA